MTRRGNSDNGVLPREDRQLATVWIVALTTCLAMLGLAAALALVPAASGLSGQIAGRATIQIVDGDTVARRDTVRRVREALDDARFVAAIHVVPEAELDAMAARWLGDGVRDAGLPLPALIDVDLVSDNAAAMERLRALVSDVAPRARVTPQAHWLGPVAGLLTALGWLAVAIALALVLAAAAVAVVGVRAALTAQQQTIDILHLVGATDVQIARLFQRHSARAIIFGAITGGIAAIALGLLVAWQFAAISSGIADSGAGWRYLSVLLVPPALIGLSLVAARRAVLRALAAMP